MKKNNKIILLVILIIAVLAYVGYLVVKSFEKKETKLSELSCTFMVKNDEFNNTTKEKYDYELTVTENNEVVNYKVTIEQYFKDYDTFYENYSRYNDINNKFGTLVAYDFDTYLTVIQKEEKVNMTLDEFKNKNRLENIECKPKEKETQVEVEQKNESDIEYLCKKDTSIYYLLTEQNGLIKTIKSGTEHKMNDIDEFNQRRSVLKDNEYVSYLYDVDNLTITQLNIIVNEEDITAREYMSKYLSAYDCNKIGEQ